jgi:hypothetical protein
VNNLDKNSRKTLDLPTFEAHVAHSRGTTPRLDSNAGFFLQTFDSPPALLLRAVPGTFDPYWRNCVRNWAIGIANDVKLDLCASV